MKGDDNMDNDDVLVDEPNDENVPIGDSSYIWVEDFYTDDDLVIDEQVPSSQEIKQNNDTIEDVDLLDNPVIIKDNSLTEQQEPEPEPSTELGKLEKTFRPRFEYNNKSTVSIIGTPMILVSVSSIEDPSSTRNKIQGESTISRLITNEYGTIYEPLSFTYGLMKVDYSPFTEREQRIVERWLTSPKLSSELKLTNCDGDQYSYYGTFLGPMTWVLAGGEYVMCEFTFNVNGAYPYKYYEFKWDASEVGDHGILELYCSSDELEEYVYPTIKATAISKDYNSSYEIIQHTDGNKSFKISTLHCITLVADCQHCRVYEGLDMGEYIAESEQNRIYFEDLGWGDADTIYWPRILPGWNIIEIKGNVELTISYYAPYKKVGGWLT